MVSNRKIVFIIALLITLSGMAYFLLVFIPQRVAQQAYDGAKQLGQDLTGAFKFTPEISVNNTVIIQQQSPILEVATLSQRFHHTYRWSNVLFYSKKEIKVEGTFEAKIGFDLHDKFLVRIQGNKAIVNFPAPKLLSLENLQDIKFRDENGLINWINTGDRSAAINAFTQNAREFADNEKFKQEAALLVQKELLVILKSYVDEVELIIGTDRLVKDFREAAEHPLEKK